MSTVKTKGSQVKLCSSAIYRSHTKKEESKDADKCWWLKEEARQEKMVIMKTKKKFSEKVVVKVLMLLRGRLSRENRQDQCFSILILKINEIDVFGILKAFGSYHGVGR